MIYGLQVLSLGEVTQESSCNWERDLFLFGDFRKHHRHINWNKRMNGFYTSALRLIFPSPMHESEKWKWKWSRVRLLVTPWTTAYQAPPSMGFSKQGYWSGVPLPSPDTHKRHCKCSRYRITSAEISWELGETATAKGFISYLGTLIFDVSELRFLTCNI